MDALAIVDSLLGDDPKGIAQESYDDFHASAKVKSANPEVRLMPSRRFEYGQDVLLMTDGGPLYAGTIVPRGKLWKIAAVAKNLGRRTLGSIDFYTETPEEAAQGLLDALKPWWENKLRWQSAAADVVGEALDDQAEVQPITEQDMPEVKRILLSAFSAHAADAWKIITDSVDWSISRKAVVGGKIVGVYALGRGQLGEDLKRFEKEEGPFKFFVDPSTFDGLHGIEGVALATDESFRGRGAGRALIESVRSSGADYIWGGHLKSLGNLDNWLKRRKLVAEGPNIYYTAQVFKSAGGDTLLRGESLLDFDPKETALEMTALPEGYTLRPNPKWNAKDRIEEQPVFDVVDPGGSVIGTLFHYSGRGPEDEGLHWAAMRRKPDGLLDMERGTDYFKHQPEAVAHLIRLVPNKVSARVAEALCDEIDAAAEDAAKPNSPEQAEAGNYQKGHCSLHGLQIAIENAKGSTRSGTCDDGSTWSVTMPAHYGYIKGTQGKDKDHIDVYIGPKPGGFLIFVVNQNTKGGKFDEHKCMFGFESKDDAIKAYDAAFNDGLGPKLRASVVSTTVDNFKAWLEDGNHKKPFENVSESLVTEMLDSDLKDFAGEVPMRQTFGDLQPGDVIQTEGGDGPIYQIVGRFYDQTGRYRRSFLGLDHKHNQAMNPGTAVEYVEYCPSLAYGEFDRRSAAAAEEPFNSEVKYLGTTDEWTPERIWAHMKETGERNRRGNAQDYNRNNPDDPNNPYGPHDGPPPPPRHVPRRRPPQPPLRRE